MMRGLSLRVGLAVAVLIFGLFPAQPAKAAVPLPPGNWVVTWQDQFDGTQLDGSKWTTWSSSMAEGCRGNLQWHTLPYNLPENVTVANGLLSLTARRESYTSPGGVNYDWTSGLITTGDSCGHDPSNGAWVRPGQYLRIRTKLPGAVGMWPAFWTWYGPDNEVDVFEHHGDRPNILEVNNRTPGGSYLFHDAGTDLTLGWHDIGARIGTDSVDWYLDGQLIYSDPNGFNRWGAYLIVNLAVSDGFWHSAPPASVTTATMQVDFVEVYTPA